VSAQKTTPQAPLPPDLILVGKKPPMAYASAIGVRFQSGANVLTVKARGRAISTAVDAVEIVRKRLFQGKISVKSIAIGTQQVSGSDGRSRNVSTIEMILEKT